MSEWNIQYIVATILCIVVIIFVRKKFKSNGPTHRVLFVISSSILGIETYIVFYMLKSKNHVLSVGYFASGDLQNGWLTYWIWCPLYLFFNFQEPRPLSQVDLEKVLATSRKAGAAASTYTGLSSQALGGWSRHREGDDYQVQAAISELSKLVVSQILNIQSDPQQDPWIFSLHIHAHRRSGSLLIQLW